MGVAVVVILAKVYDSIPGDSSQGDGSCPSCDAYIKRFQDQKSKEQAAQQQQQQGQNQGSSQDGSPQGQQQGEAQQQLGPNGGRRNAADQKRLDVQRERRNTRRENRSRDAAGPLQGRFVGPDDPFADWNTADPQRWNLYSYTSNDPMNLIDLNDEPWAQLKVADGVWVYQWFDDEQDENGKSEYDYALEMVGPPC